MGLTKSYARFIENIGIIRTTIAPIRLTRLQLTKLFLAQVYRDLVFLLMSSYASMVGKYSNFVENIGIIRTTIAPIRLSRWQLTKLFLGQIWRDAGFLTWILLVLLMVTVSALILDRLIRPQSLEALGIPVGGSSKGTKMDFQQMLEDCKSKVYWSPSSHCMLTTTEFPAVS